jgi:hypothetical protein
VSHWELKGEICSRGSVLGNFDECQRALQIELRPINTADFDMPDIPVVCRDRTQPIDPAVVPSPDAYALGDGNQVMLMRVCLQVDPMFATTKFGARMNTPGPDGGVSIVATTTFVNEPRT